MHDRLVSRAHRSDLSVLHDHLQTERKARRPTSTFLKEQYKALGAVSKKEKQGIIIVAIAIILWITQKLHGVDAGFVAIAADVAFFAAGLLTAPEANAKGQWTLVVFIGASSASPSS